MAASKDEQPPPGRVLRRPVSGKPVVSIVGIAVPAFVAALVVEMGLPAFSYHARRSRATPKGAVGGRTIRS